MAEKKSSKQSVKKAGVAVFSASGKELEKITLPKDVFDKDVSPQLLSQAVRVYQANQRQGTQATKTRGEVSYSTRKLFKQKGTGRARHGSRKAPIFVGGGIAFGPQPRDFSLSLSQQQKQRALLGALSIKARDAHIMVVKDLEGIGPKTKTVATLLQRLQLSGIRSVLAVITGKGEVFLRGSRNIPNLFVVRAENLNSYDVLLHTQLIISQKALEALSVREQKNSDKHS